VVCLVAVFRRDGCRDGVYWNIVANEGVVAKVYTLVRQTLSAAGLSEVEDYLEGLRNGEKTQSKSLSFHGE
jgi:hypothetical protein